MSDTRTKKKRKPREIAKARERAERRAIAQAVSDANGALQALLPGVPVEFAPAPHPQGRAR